MISVSNGRHLCGWHQESVYNILHLHIGASGQEADLHRIVIFFFYIYVCIKCHGMIHGYISKYGLYEWNNAVRPTHKFVHT